MVAMRLVNRACSFLCELLFTMISLGSAGSGGSSTSSSGSEVGSSSFISSLTESFARPDGFDDAGSPRRARLSSLPPAPAKRLGKSHESLSKVSLTEGSAAKVCSLVKHSKSSVALSASMSGSPTLEADGPSLEERTCQQWKVNWIRDTKYRNKPKKKTKMIGIENFGNQEALTLPQGRSVQDWKLVAKSHVDPKSKSRTTFHIIDVFMKKTKMQILRCR